MHESIEPNSDRIASLEKALAHDEADLELYRELGEMYTEAGRLREAFQVFKRGLEASGGHNLKLRELVEDAQIRMVRGQVAIAEKRAAAEKTVESQELAKRFRTELNRQELAVLASRSDRYPHDLSLKFELGIRLKREENFREARGAFEAARAEPKLRGLATLELGECFQHLRQYGNAAKCYQAAVEQLETNSEPYKLALYRGGVLATALKNLDAARKALEQLWRIDPNFRDVASRLDKLSRIGDKE
jgi:tetratricopeptide (TPR) repeat protein